MANEEYNVDGEDCFEEPEASDPQLPSFTIGLDISGDADSSFRLQNDPSAPRQRKDYVQRKSAIDIRCSCVDVVHGLFSPEGKAFATLIILEFRFDVRKRARRITLADIALEFAGMVPGEVGPEVFNISPLGNLNLMPTTHVEQLSHNGNVSVGAGTMVTASGTLGWEKSVTKDKSDHTTVIGSIDLIGRNYGSKNCATWTLIENASMKTGVPVFMRTAILLKRKSENPFKCLVTIKAHADFKTSMEQVFGRQPKDDPVLFDPELPPTNNLQEYDVHNLGAFDVEAASDLTFSTVLADVVKEKALHKF